MQRLDHLDVGFLVEDGTEPRHDFVVFALVTVDATACVLGPPVDELGLVVQVAQLTPQDQQSDADGVFEGGVFRHFSSGCGWLMLWRIHSLDEVGDLVEDAGVVVHVDGLNELPIEVLGQRPIEAQLFVELAPENAERRKGNAVFAGCQDLVVVIGSEADVVDQVLAVDGPTLSTVDLLLGQDEVHFGAEIVVVGTGVLGANDVAQRVVEIAIPVRLGLPELPG